MVPNSGATRPQTPSDDSGLASQQVSVANSEATLMATPIVEDSDETQMLAGISYDQPQLGMLSVSFLDATHHSTHHPPPLSSSLALQTDLMSAADYHRKLVVSTAERNEAALSQESQGQRVSELEREVRLRDERLTDTLQQRVVSETEEAKTEVESLRQQLLAAQETLTAMQQGDREAREQLREARDSIQAQKQTLESLQTQCQLRVQMLDSQILQLQEELQAAQRNCAGAVHEKEAMHQENKRLARLQVALEGMLRRVEAETGDRQRELEAQLRQREDEVRELEAVRAEVVCAQREAQEGLTAERDELRQRLGDVEHQLALLRPHPLKIRPRGYENLVSKLQRELLQQQECPDLLRITSLFSETHSPAKVSPGTEALQQTRAQLRSRETGDGDGRAQTATSQRVIQVRLRCWLVERRRVCSNSAAHRLSPFSPVLAQVRLPILAAGKEWFEVYSEEDSRSVPSPLPVGTHCQPTVQKQLLTLCHRFCKQLPPLSVEQLTAAVNSLSQVVGALSERLSAVSDLLTQLISGDREALARDTDSLRDTIASLQTQLQQQSEGVSVQTQKVFEENEQLRIELRDAEHRLRHQSEINAQQRASVEAESSRGAQLEREKLAAVSQLETEVKGLQRLLKSVTSDLEEAQSRLAEYQEAEGSLERSTHTISSLHQELRASKEKEAELDKALHELTQSQSEMGQRRGSTHMQHQATLASLQDCRHGIQEALEVERATKDEMVGRLSEVQGQLEESQEARGADAAERRQRLEECERELERGRRAGEAQGGERCRAGQGGALQSAVGETSGGWWWASLQSRGQGEGATETVRQSPAGEVARPRSRESCSTRAAARLINSTSPPIQSMYLVSVLRERVELERRL
ncbi:hypothetical protein GBAR_LOCUS12579 [Geodia barretti]|uniref:Uncharacterized protein n=1 Tax=Geodia barretti TaxID=519541 RepID=A0AA35S2Z8_GEOBA|nr:hypothetical protein GBAR_LOCUS12579 [Geodia barretti]